MRFKQYYILEKFLKGVDILGKYIEFFKEPTAKEINDIVRNSEYKSVRFGVTDKKKPIVFAWDGGILHKHAQYFGDLPFKFGFYYESKSKTIISDKSLTDWGDWKDYKNKDALIKRIKTMLPDVKKITFWPMKKPIEL